MSMLNGGSRGMVGARKCLLLAAAVTLLGAGVASVGAAPRTNVIVILADDLGNGDLGCYGHSAFKTPRLDQMAAAGARFTQFYSACPYCAPSRAALQTGRYPFRSGFTNNPLPIADPAGREELDKLGLPLTERTLGEIFRGSGYRTACIGKWHLGHQPEFRPRRRGYDEYLGILYSNDMHRVELLDGERVVEYPVVQSELTRRYTDRAIRFIEKNRSRPFFLYLPHAMPHKPLAASEAFYKKSGAGLYGDAIQELDASTGRILDRLKELGLDSRTLVVFTSDNGPWYGGSTGGLRGMKSQTWEGGVRVPCIAYWPGKIPSGQTVQAPSIMMDVFSTALDAAGISPPSDRPVDGQSLLRRLRASSGPVTEHQALFSVTTRGLTAVRSGPWKLLLEPASGPALDRVWKEGEPYVDPRAPDGVRLLAPFEQMHPSRFPGTRDGDPGVAGALFNLENDPSEKRDVSATHPEVVARLRGLVRKVREQPL